MVHCEGLFFFAMTYTLNIDQEFALYHQLTLTQVSALAAFLSLPLWAERIVKDGDVWYEYSDEKMSEDFPLLFGVPKRCYKNLSDLEGMGFVQTTKVGRKKFVRFTALCASWNREKSEIGLTYSEKSENGLISGGCKGEKSEVGLNSKKEEKVAPKEARNLTNTELSKEKCFASKESTLFPTEGDPLRASTTEEIIEKKREAFSKACEPYVAKYGEAMIKAFVNYWGEANGKRLRWEVVKEKSGAFEISRRLATWAGKEYNRPVTPTRPKKHIWEEMGLTEEQYRKIQNG